MGGGERARLGDKKAGNRRTTNTPHPHPDTHTQFRLAEASYGVIQAEPTLAKLRLCISPSRAVGNSHPPSLRGPSAAKLRPRPFRPWAWPGAGNEFGAENGTDWQGPPRLSWGVGWGLAGGGRPPYGFWSKRNRDICVTLLSTQCFE